MQSALGAKNAVAFDLSAACSGFLFSLNTADVYLKSGFCKYALVIGAETLSKIMDWSDRSTCVLFGDGAGAAVLCVEEADAAAQQEGILGTVLGSDGAKGMVLRCDNRPVNNPYVKNDTAPSYVSMNGQEVYKFAVKTVPRVIEEAVKAVAKRLHQPMEKFPTNLQEYGNISAASVPILLDNVNNHGMIKKGSKIVLAGFGAGLTWGAAVLRW